MKFRNRVFYGAALLSSASLSAQQQPNVLFIMLDDFGYHQLGCNGSTFFETPNIDRLASEGMNFTNAYASASVSSPTRAALMSGMYPARTHTTDWLNGYAEPENSDLVCPNWTKGLNKDDVRLPVMMQSGGYVTAMIGKWHLSKDLPGWDLIERNDGPDITQESDWHNVKKYTDTAIEFMTESKEQGKPFFCYLSHNSIHTPETEEAALIQKYRDKPGATEKGMWNPVQGAMVETVDKENGRLLQAVKDLGLEENTIIVFYADNGQFTPNEKVGPSPLRGGKVTLWEGGVREPLIVKWKGRIEAGSTCDEQVIAHDFLPTLYDLCGLTDESFIRGIDGVSFAEALMGNESAAGKREYLCWHYPHYHPEAEFLGSIRKGDWKLIENFGKSLFFYNGAFELYNLAEDPDESENLINSNLEKAAELYADLQNWRTETNAQMPYMKKESFGVAHFVFHASHEVVKANLFERQQGLTHGLQFDGEGTYIELPANGTLGYFYEKQSDSANRLRVLCKNPGNANITLEYTNGADKQPVVVEAGTWKEVVFDMASVAVGKGVFWLQSIGGALCIDKWIIDDGTNLLVHDGTLDDVTDHNVVTIATFEDGSVPFYSTLLGNSNQQLQTPVVVDNPHRDEINTSSKCLYVRTRQDKDKGIPAWSANNIVIWLKETVEINDDNRFLHVMHWKGQKLNSWLIYGSADGVNYVELGRGGCPAAQQWFDIVVDVKSQLNELRTIKIILDGNWTNNAARYYEPTDFYYDEIVLSDTFAPRAKIESSVGSVKRDSSQLVSIAPNPTKDYVKVNTVVPISEVKIYSTNGQLQRVQSCNPDETNVHIVRLQGLDSGYYFLVAVQPNGVAYTHSLIVSK